MEKYCVYLIRYSGNKLPKFYIGSTSIEKINNGYLGSVKSKKWEKVFEEEKKRNKDLFSVEIISKHETRGDALISEYKLQRERNVVKSSDYFNESFANINGYFGRDVRGEINPMYGRKNEVIAINVKTNEKKRVSVEEFENNHDLSGHTFGLVSVIDIKTGDKKMITKETFKLDVYKYVHHNKGKKHTVLTKNKLSKIRSNMITAKDWEGNFHRVNKDDPRFKTGEFGNTTSKRWVIEDLDGNIYKTLNFKKFFEDNGLQYPRPENIVNGVIIFKQKTKKTTTNGWKIKCLDK
jgi:hypothetical protein